ncbi:MAG: YbaB/EbfC family nucleoid-associated protein [Erysipelotrichaceae bacterium]|nr:YbaB/EbfC family nucleoid-associated protein [Erysipelotrichaceae bacterium]
MDLNKLMQQAGDLQKQLEETGKQIGEMEFEAEASNGLVKVTVNGDSKVLKVAIDESILNKEDKEMIEDLLMIAVNNALSKVEEYKKDAYGAMGSSLSLPF